MLLPVSSYTTSTPAAVRTRSTVWPVHDAAGYSAEHMLTVKVWPAEAVTPHVASRSVSATVFERIQDPHSVKPVGARVGTALGDALGVVGIEVGMAVGCLGSADGLGEGRAVGTGLGSEVVGANVGSADGGTVGGGEGVAVGGKNVGAAVVGMADDGTCVGVAVGLKCTAVTPAPAMADWPVHALLAMQPCRMT